MLSDLSILRQTRLAYHDAPKVNIFTINDIPSQSLEKRTMLV